jgi:hypothetical protein
VQRNISLFIHRILSIFTVWLEAASRRKIARGGEKLKAFAPFLYSPVLALAVALYIPFFFSVIMVIPVAVGQAMGKNKHVKMPRITPRAAISIPKKVTTAR